MTSLEVTADIPQGTDLLGLTADDLQTDINIGDSSIIGTLNYVEEYTGFSDEVTEQSGNYIALQALSDDDGAEITVEFVGSDQPSKTLDSDGILIARITDSITALRFTAAVAGKSSNVKTYDITGLTLEEA